MSLAAIAALLIIVAAGVSYVNRVVLHIPASIGLLVGGLVASAFLIVADRVAPDLIISKQLEGAIAHVNFAGFLLQGVLSFLLFGGALHLDLDDLRREKVSVLVLASAGVVISTVVIGFGSYEVFRMFSLQIPLADCFVFGAIISPTDPIAVLGIMKTVGAPKALDVRITGESLFNDGFTIVLFAVLAEIAMNGPKIPPGSLALHGALLFLREAGGGVALGFVCGLIAYQLMKRVDEPNVEVLLSLALVMAISVIADRFETSAPLAAVIAGLFIGNQGRKFAMKDASREALDVVWSFLDYLANALLFLLLGLQAVLLWRSAVSFFVILALIPLALAARWCSIAVSTFFLRRHARFERAWIVLLVWGGLRGGISVAMALSLPSSASRGAIVIATYGIVIFSVVVQGLTMHPLLRRLLPAREAAA